MKKTKHNQERNTLRKRLWIPAALALLLLVLGVTAGPALAKYITERFAPENIVEAYNFYFTSNYLTDADTMPVIPVNASTTQLSFELYNADDMLRFADLDIDYTVTVTAKMKDASNSWVAAPADDAPTVTLPDVCTLAKDARRTATVTLSGLKNGYRYEVVAVGTNSFTKTLRAAFEVATDPAQVYKHLASYDEYVILTVWTKGEAMGNASIIYPAGLTPDNTDPAMNGWAAGSATGSDTTSFANTMYASHQYRFFKTGTGTFAVGDFTVTVGGVEATAANPID